jgi:hypothetical protein
MLARLCWSLKRRIRQARPYSLRVPGALTHLSADHGADVTNGAAADSSARHQTPTVGEP